MTFIITESDISRKDLLKYSDNYHRLIEYLGINADNPDDIVLARYGHETIVLKGAQL